MFQTKFVQKIKTRILLSKSFFFIYFSKLVPYEIKWKNGVESDRPLMTPWYMRIACWIPKATNTHSEYVILFAFAMRQWRGCAPVLFVHAHRVFC
jgi:hypothetical protein